MCAGYVLGTCIVSHYAGRITAPPTSTPVRRLATGSTPVDTGGACHVHGNHACSAPMSAVRDSAAHLSGGHGLRELHAAADAVGCDPADRKGANAVGMRTATHMRSGKAVLLDPDRRASRRATKLCLHGASRRVRGHAYVRMHRCRHRLHMYGDIRPRVRDVHSTVMTRVRRLADAHSGGSRDCHVIEGGW